MARIKPGRGHFHIKQNTVGTSNEISFSVLDSKKIAMSDNTEKPGPRTVSELGKVSVFTMPGGGDTPDGSGVTTLNLEGTKVHQLQLPTHVAYSTTQHEIEVRKRQRRSRRLLNVFAVIVVLGVLGLAAGRFVFSTYEARTASQAVVDEALGLLMQTDEAVLSLDEAVAEPAQADIAQLRARADDLAAAASLIDRAANRAQEALNMPEADAQSELAAEIREAAIARKALVVAGQHSLELAAAAKTATDQAENAWDLLTRADEVARQAAVVPDTATGAELEKFNELSQQAVDLFSQAALALQSAQNAFPQVDLAGYKEYAELRAEAQHSALTSNAALAAQDKVLAGINSKSYNEAETRAAALLDGLPSSPTEAIVEAYTQVGGDASDVYRQARERASRADAALREHLDSA